MTSRSAFLIFVALLLTASLAGAAAPAQSATPGTAAFMTPAAPAEVSSGCNPLLSKLGISPLESARETTYPPCGGCSELACRGRLLYDNCGGTIRQPKQCRVRGDLCTDGAANCGCVNAILP